MSNPIILAIESSCDDTAAAVIKAGKVLSNVVSSQTEHKDLGGVVPELASRAHMQQIVYVVDRAIQLAGIAKKEINAIAVTKGPGLLGPLLVGVNFAKTLSVGLGVPLIDVHHMHAHIMANFATPPYPEFPFINLTVSGGHTQLVLVHSHLEMEVLGESLDDAAGEAFDKTGKLLQLPYPAGPIIDKLAAEGKPVYHFPSAKVSGLNFSFSGLKTSILYFLRDKTKANPEFIQEEINNICASVQAVITATLIEKLQLAIDSYPVKSITLSGGVAANSALRKAIQELAMENEMEYHIPDFAFCTDNAAMIGVAAHYKYIAGQFSDLQLTAEPKSTMRRRL